MNRLGRVWALFGHECQSLRRDPFPLVLIFFMPVALMFFFTPAYQGSSPFTGAAQAVPGMTVTFAFFAIAVLGLSIFREHGWQTWERLLASRLTRLELYAGKALVPLVLVASQVMVLTVVGVAFFGLIVRGSWLALLLVALAFAIALAMVGLMVVGLCRTWQQVNVIGNLCAVLLGGLGGGLVPVARLPGPARALSPLTPSYWGVSGIHGALAGGAGQWPDVGRSCGILLLYAAVSGAIAWYRLRRHERKVVVWA